MLRSKLTENWIHSDFCGFQIWGFQIQVQNWYSFPSFTAISGLLKKAQRSLICGTRNKNVPLTTSCLHQIFYPFGISQIYNIKTLCHYKIRYEIISKLFYRKDTLFVILVYFWTILFPYKLFVTEKKTYISKLKFPIF